LVGKAHTDSTLATIAQAGQPRPTTPLAVVGAHLTGQPLNAELVGRGGVLAARTTTAPAYRLFALDTVPPKPGLVRDPAGDTVEAEVWDLPTAAFGDFVANLPAPMAIGKVELADGSWVPGFTCERHALDDAADITSYGGWRAYLSR
jgi:allophanate hydrolase